MLDAADGRRPPTGYECDNAILTTLSGTLDTLADGHIFTSAQRITLAQAFGDQYTDDPDEARPKLNTMRLPPGLQRIVADESETKVKGILAAALQSAKSGN